MGYPATAPVLTNQQSIDLVVQSEANILQGLNDLYCTEFVAALLADTTTPVEDRFLIMTNVLNTMACKECTIANVLTAASHVLAVDKGLLPTAISKEDCPYCNCNCK